jgi:Fe-S cluster assembly scaffold protein SufB
VVRDISAKKNEPEWMLQNRLKALRIFQRKPMPPWGSNLEGIDFDNVKYFVRSTEKQAGSTLASANKGEIFTSFDVDAFEVPGGRDEIWRFTPLRRLRGLHDGTAKATGKARIEVTPRRGVTVETVRRGDERLGQGGVPADRVSAQAFSSFNTATIVTVERHATPEQPVDIAIGGRRRSGS